MLAISPRRTTALLLPTATCKLVRSAKELMLDLGITGMRIC
ncbi:Uncharacterised protein [Vibrio cholerae]|nr:Uncharacterised protein [Vibrio cholerae]CSI33481.1 Uncharacterised protein [Vibrio cholerae]CSI61869.1 Uncharacterised protein [Vibrio cholerae]